MNHLIVPRFLILLLLFPLFYGCSSRMSDQIKEEISNNEKEQAFVNTDYAVFVFTIDTGGSWQWFRNSTNMGQLEYGWWTTFQAEGKNYTCGFKLFKHPFSQPTDGNFKKLIDAGQIDLAVGQNRSQKKISDNFVAVGMTYKRIPYARVQAITQKNKLIILLREKSIVRDLHKTRPDSITFISQTRVGQPEQFTVPIAYDLE